MAPAIHHWQPGVQYGKDSMVCHHGAYWVCLLTHTGQLDWQPSQKPMLWRPAFMPEVTCVGCGRTATVPLKTIEDGWDLRCNRCKAEGK
jgi:hypothetical protein